MKSLSAPAQALLGTDAVAHVCERFGRVDVVISNAGNIDLQAVNVFDNNDPNSFNWDAFDHKALEAPFTFFQKLKERGVDRFVGSVWTAPAWMKTNQIYTDGGALRPDERAEFAEYLSAVTQLAKQKAYELREEVG